MLDLSKSQQRRVQAQLLTFTYYLVVLVFARMQSNWFLAPGCWQLDPFNFTIKAMVQELLYDELWDGATTRQTPIIQIIVESLGCRLHFKI
jgi:hypothetical protein